MLYDKRWDVAAKPLADWQRVLLAAADLIECDGHCKGCLVDLDGRRCAMGAIFMACLDDSAVNAVIAERAEHALFRHISCTIVEWNDAPERTAAEVVAALRGAAGVE